MSRKLFSQLLDTLGLKVCTLVDIGARHGVDNRWLLLGDRLFVIGFEPDQEACANLASSVNGSRSIFIPTALSNHAGGIEFHICSREETSSCYVPKHLFVKRFPEAERFDVSSKREIAVDTLDNILSNRINQPVDFIKIDVQGYERNVLEGARKKAGEAFGIEVEVEFSELYKGQPLFSDVDVLVRDLGFTLFDIRPCYWKRTERPCKGVGQMVFADALYFRDPIASNVIPQCPGASIAICSVYHKFDYALELARFFRENGVYTSDHYARIQDILLKMSTPRVSCSKYRGSMRVANFLESIVNWLRGGFWFRYDNWKM